MVQSWAAIYVPFICTFRFSLFSYNFFNFRVRVRLYTLACGCSSDMAATAVGTLAIRVDKFRRALCLVLVGLPHFCGLGVFSRPTFAEHGFHLLRFLLISLMI